MDARRNENGIRHTYLHTKWHYIYSETSCRAFPIFLLHYIFCKGKIQEEVIELFFNLPDKCSDSVAEQDCDAEGEFENLEETVLSTEAQALENEAVQPSISEARFEFDKETNDQDELHYDSDTDTEEVTVDWSYDSSAFAGRTPIFDVEPSVKANSTSADSVLVCFEEIFNDGIVNNIVKQTNLYASQDRVKRCNGRKVNSASTN